MGLDGRLREDVIVVHGDARQRFYDARGYGYPLDGNDIALDPIEAAHLLYRDDLDAVVDGDERLGFRAFVEREPGDAFMPRFLVYADLRSRGYYLVPAKRPWVSTEVDGDLAVFPRGSGPTDGDREFPVRVIGERRPVGVDELDTGMLAVVDEERGITYFGIDRPEIDGSTTIGDHPPAEATVLSDGVLVWNPPADLYEQAFVGQPLETRGADRSVLQCSFLEAAYLADRGLIDVDRSTVVDAARSIEGERFDRRLLAYEALRDRGVTPKTGYKFGADFRTYAAIDDIDDLDHSELLIRVLPSGHRFEPRDIALDVRLAHGVRKTMVYAVVDEATERIDWLSIERETP